MAIDLSPPPDGASADEIERAFWRNAHFLAVASNLAYLPGGGDDGVAGQFEAQLGATGAVLLPEGDPGVDVRFVVAETDADIVVAFRGTESPLTPGGAGLRDWLVTDAGIRLRAPGDGEATWSALGAAARVHTGFFDAILQIQDGVRAEVEKRVRARARPVWLTGHSLGGALAHLAAWDLDRNADDVEVRRVVTFAAPMAVDFNAADQYDRFLRSREFRFVNVSDVIPSLPILDLLNNPYRHVGQRIELPAEEQAPSTAEGVLGQLRDLAANLAGSLTKAALRGILADMILKRVNAHLLVKGYISRIEAWRRAHGDSVP
jgi:hypothetical protein